MTITKLASTFGVRTSALRYYEKAGLLAPAGRVQGRRVYDKSAVQRLSFIFSAQESGLTLGEISQLIQRGEDGAAPRRLWRVVAQRKLGELDRQITELTAKKAALQEKLGCRCNTLSRCETLLAQRRAIR